MWDALNIHILAGLSSVSCGRDESRPYKGIYSIHSPDRGGVGVMPDVAGGWSRDPYPGALSDVCFVIFRVAGAIYAV